MGLARTWLLALQPANAPATSRGRWSCDDVPSSPASVMCSRRCVRRRTTMPRVLASVLIVSFCSLLLAGTTRAAAWGLPHEQREHDLQYLEVAEDCCLSGDVVMTFRINLSYGDFVVRYKLDSNDKTTGGELTLDPETGFLTLLEPFDYERRQDYRLNVSAAIYQRSSRDSTRTFEPTPLKIISLFAHIKVLNVNDEAPRLLQTDYRCVVPESVAPHTFLLRIDATDPDGDNELTYVIPEGHPSRALFDLNSVTGELMTRAPLDREQQTVHRIPVYVFDAGQEHMTATEAVVLLEYINKNAPIFNVNNQVIRVPENILPGTIFYTVVASDSDLLHGAASSDLSQSALSYRILSGNTDDSFTIDAASGDISTTGPLDRERQASFELLVEASDSTFSTTSNLTVELQDINENSPVFDRDVYYALLDVPHGEDPTQARQVITVKAHDPDSTDRIYYTINATSSPEAIYFNIEPESGMISVVPSVLMQAQRLRERARQMTKSSVFTFDVLAMDVGSSYAVHTTSATVQVTYVPSSSPSPRLGNYPYVMEVEGHRSDFRVGTQIGKIDMERLPEEMKVVVSDEQSNYRCSDFLHVDGQTGAVRVKRALNSNMYECYLELRPSKGGAPSTSALLQILFLKGISPEMKARKAKAFTLKVELSEAMETATPIVNLVSRSRMPSLKSGQHKFHFAYSSVDASYFNLQPNTGVIYLKKRLDYETLPADIELVAVAKNTSNPFENPIYFNIQLSLINVNDNPPKFTQEHYTATVSEGEHRGTLVTQIAALDVDDLGLLMSGPLTYEGEARATSKVTYHILEGNHDNAFIIAPAGSGVVKTNIVLDREIRGSYTLKIEARDEGSAYVTADGESGQKFAAHCTLEIIVIDANDNLPVFPPYQEISVPYETEVGSVVSTLTANDVDTYPTLTYYKQKGAPGYSDAADELFDVGLFTGRITLKAPLASSPRDRRKEYNLKILASDSLHTVETQVRIKIKSGDAFTSPPPLGPKEYDYVTVNPLLNDCVGSGGINCEVARVAAVERDDDERLQLKAIYRLESDPSHTFYVDHMTGIVYSNRSLKFAANKMFHVTVLAGYSREGGRFVNALRSRASLLMNVLKSEMDDDFSETEPNVYNIKVTADKLDGVLLALPLAHKYRYKIVGGNQAGDYVLLRNNQLARIKQSSTADVMLEIRGSQLASSGTVRVLVNIEVLSEGMDLAPLRVHTTRTSTTTTTRMPEIISASSNIEIFNGTVQPDNLSSPTITPTNSAAIPGWILFLVVLLMLITVILLFSIVVIRMYQMQRETMMGRSHCGFGMNTLLPKQGGPLNEASMDISSVSGPNYVHDADMLNAHHHHGAYLVQTSNVAPPPCYNEVTLSPNAEGLSASSGRGSAEDDVDEEVRMILEGNDYYGDCSDDCADRDSTVPTTAQYLARLGVVDHMGDEMLKQCVAEEDDCISEVALPSANLGNPLVRATMFSSVRSCRDRTATQSRRHRSQRNQCMDAWPAECDSAVSSIGQEELTESYGWDYLQNWGPKYQSISSVFSEIARLKGAAVDADPYHARES